MTNERSIRDWRAGDGLRCAHAGKAPPEIPCGPPVKAQIRLVSTRPGGAKTERIWALCGNHAGGLEPGHVMIQARREAMEQVIANHWDEYDQHLKAAIRRLVTPEDAS